MLCRVLQDWITVSCASPYTFIQGESSWVETSAYQDAHFVVDVRHADTTSLLLQFETAPAQDSVLFSPMVAGLDLVPLVGLSKVVDCYANVVSGPPLASWLRWAIYGSANWNACFRITMVAL